mgnify:FL=1
MYMAFLFLSICVILFCVRFVRGKKIQTDKQMYDVLMDMHSISQIFDVLSVITICACFVVDFIFLDDAVRESIWILLIEILWVICLLLAAVIFDRYYWGEKGGSIVNRPCFGKAKSVSYDAVEYFTIEGSGDVRLHLCDQSSVILPSMDKEMTTYLQNYLIGKHLKYKDRLTHGSVMMHESRSRKILASVVFVTAILIFLAGIYWGPDSQMYLLIIGFCLFMLLGSTYDLIARCYNYVLFDGKEIINRRFLRKNIVVTTKDVKQYRVREIDNAEVVELITADNKKIKISMLWDNSYMIDTYIKKYQWKPCK